MEIDYDDTVTNIMKEYYESLTDFEKHGMRIAKQHLGSSFDLKRSSGFIKWKEFKEKKVPTQPSHS